MSNYKAITGSSKIVHRNQGGGSKLQGIPSTTNLNTWAHVAFRNRNVVCPCNRNLIFCMNQLGGVGAGGIPGRSYAFAPSADGTRKQFYCGHRFVNGKWIIYPKYNIIAKYPDKVLFGIMPKPSPDDGLYPFVVYSFPLVINNTYKVIINNKAAIFKITNFISNPYQYMKQAELFILTSLYEGLPNVLLEAQGLKKFIISSNCPTGPREILLNGKAGFLFSIGNEIELSKKILDYYKNKKKLNKMINLGYKNIDRFDSKKNLLKYYNLINNYL